MQRAETVGTRYRLNDDEYTQRVTQRDQTSPTTTAMSSRWIARKNSRSDSDPSAAPCRPRRTGSSAPGRSAACPHMSSIRHGRIPALTPAAQAAGQQRQQAQAARRKQLNGIEAEWTTDRSNYDRCISTGVLNSITPKIYNSGSRIVQGPGWLAFQNEMIHETRVIPTDGRQQVGSGVKNWMGTSVGRWEGDVLVVETATSSPSRRSTASRCRKTAC